MSSFDYQKELWDRLWGELADVRKRLDNKADRREVEKYGLECDSRLDKLEDQIRKLERAAITPNEVDKMIHEGLTSSETRGVTSRERQIRTLVALASIATFAMLVYDRFFT